jgi:guanidinoacetate N-methyltransferase
MQSQPYENWDKKHAIFEKDRLIIDGHQVMMDWETPYMHKMAKMLHEYSCGGDILEIGFGMGISATEIQRLGVKSHTIIEPHPEVYEKAMQWKASQKNSQINIINGFWQNVVDDLPPFDGIFFDTYSVTEEESQVKRFHMLKVASEKLLKEGGCITLYYLRSYLTQAYQDQIFHYYSKVILEKLYVCPPDDCEYVELDGKNYTPCILAIK